MTGSGNQQTADAPQGRRAILISASTITPETVEWLWLGRLAVRALANTVGIPDQGKSLVGTDIAARITIDSPFPPAPSRPEPWHPDAC